MTWTPQLELEAQLLHSGDSWVECWTIPVSDTHAMFVCAHTSQITVGSVTYEPAAIGRSAETADSRGGIPTLTLRISNVNRAAQARLEEDGGVLGRRLSRILVSTSDLGFSVGPSVWEIEDAEASDLEVVVRLGPVSPLEAPFPARRFQRNRCDLVYGADRCGYNKTRAGAMATCDRSLLSSNGCVAHGDDEEAAGLPRRHPIHYGGEPSIPRGPYL